MNVLIGIFIGSVILLVIYFSIRNQYSEETNSFSRFTNNKTRRSRQVFFQHEHEGTDMAKVIRENVRVFCWIMTDEQNTKTRAIHVNATWAKRCNKYVFITPAADVLVFHDLYPPKQDRTHLLLVEARRRRFCLMHQYVFGRRVIPAETLQFKKAANVKTSSRTGHDLELIMPNTQLEAVSSSSVNISRKLWNALPEGLVKLSYTPFKAAVATRESYELLVKKLKQRKNSDLPSIDLHVTEGYNFLWGKTKAAFKYIYDNELNNYDWFLKADDDTYVVVENLRFMLLAYSPDDPVYFGVRFKPFVRQGYMSGGAGYVLSRETVKRLVEDGLPDTRKCRGGEYGKEDVEIGKCLEKVDVIAGDSRDRNGKFRFLPFSPLTHLQEGSNPPDWFFAYSYYPYKQGNECCSDYVISFYYVDEATIHTIHDFIYHVRAFRVSDGFHIKEFASSKNLSLIEAACMHAKNVSQPLNLETTQ
uniref:N-acetylgalactosaminide beta-1,3-galactosyltransferase n=1 Tax=Acrobeloides nanus TaxID=290746 RepID=A0A914E2A2_9BILA